MRRSAIAQASATSRPIDRILAGAGLQAHVLVSKYSVVCACSEVVEPGEALRMEF